MGWMDCLGFKENRENRVPEEKTWKVFLASRATEEDLALMDYEDVQD
jgi:hypothetical protein